MAKPGICVGGPIVTIKYSFPSFYTMFLSYIVELGGKKVLINTNLDAKEKLYNPIYVLQKIYILPKPWNERISIFSSPMSTEAGYENWN